MSDTHQILIRLERIEQRLDAIMELLRRINGQLPEREVLQAEHGILR